MKSRVKYSILIFVTALVFLVGGVFCASYIQRAVTAMKQPTKFLLCISSFKRPIFVSGQVLRLMNQTYQNFDISLSVKGFSQSASEKTIAKEWQKLINEKRLFLRYDDNRAQFHNFLDTVRDVNLQDYDYFCKIDDDDWYAPDYLEKTQKSIQEAGFPTLSRMTNTYVITDDIKSAYLAFQSRSWPGPTICMSRELVKILLLIENDTNKEYPYYNPQKDAGDLRVNEDGFFEKIAQRIGNVDFREESDPSFAFGKQYLSVTRYTKEYVSDEIYQLGKVKRNRVGTREHPLFIQRHWVDVMNIEGNKITRQEGKDSAEFSKKDNVYKLFWPGYNTTEYFVCNEYFECKQENNAEWEKLFEE